MEKVNCNLCGSGAGTFYKRIDGYMLVRCPQCKLVYLSPRPDQEELQALYSEEYHTDKILEGAPRGEKALNKEITKNKGRAEEIVSRFGKTGRLLDVGCGAGFFLGCLKRYEWEVAGVEISEWASSFAREELDLEVHSGTLESAVFDTPFDVVTLYHNLEHQPDPLGTLKSVRQWVVPGGSVVVKGPNIRSFDRLWHGDAWRGYDVPFHLYHFNPQTYKAFLEAAGFSRVTFCSPLWNPMLHLVEMKMEDRRRADHSETAVRDFWQTNYADSLFFSQFGQKLLFVLARLLRLKGRDITITAKNVAP